MRKGFIFMMLGALLISGCAIHTKKVHKKSAEPFTITMSPSISLKEARPIKAVYIGDFENTTGFKGAHVVFKDALRYKLNERGYAIAQDAESASLVITGALSRYDFKRARVGVTKFIVSEITEGEWGRLYQAELDLSIKFTSGDKQWETRISASGQTPESEEALGCSELSLKIADRIQRQF